MQVKSKFRKAWKEECRKTWKDVLMVGEDKKTVSWSLWSYSLEYLVNNERTVAMSK